MVPGRPPLLTDPLTSADSDPPTWRVDLSHPHSHSGSICHQSCLASAQMISFAAQCPGMDGGSTAPTNLGSGPHSALVTSLHCPAGTWLQGQEKESSSIWHEGWGPWEGRRVPLRITGRSQVGVGQRADRVPHILQGRAVGRGVAACSQQGQKRRLSSDKGKVCSVTVCTQG